MTMTRRALLAAWPAAVAAWNELRADEPASRLGVVIHSFGQRAAADKDFSDPLTFVAYCHKLGAGGVQVGIGARDKRYTEQLRSQVDKARMYLEGSIRLPQERADVERFTAEVQSAKDSGAVVLRSAILSGRRYETFDTADAFRRFAERAYTSLGLAEPIIARAGARLAVENHKDFRADELIDLLKRLGSRQVGVCVDTGNSIALLEDPMAVVEAYAPLAFSTHLKDMGVQEYENGFLLAEVPFGSGFLDMKRIVGVLRKARPEIRCNVEMMTRDPLRVPCLTPKYWATFETLPGRHLAQTLSLVRKHAARQPLPRVGDLSAEKRLEVEEANVRRCLAYAREQLEL
jgi:hypothetical protein